MKKHLLTCTVAFLSLPWQWVQGQVFSNCIYGIIDEADICSFLIISLSCSLPPPQLTFVSLTLKAFEAALHWLPCIEVLGYGHCTRSSGPHGAMLGNYLFDL